MIVRASGQNLTYTIVHDLGVAIVTGTLFGQEPISVEAELCRKYGASRSILREAVRCSRPKVCSAHGRDREPG